MKINFLKESVIVAFTAVLMVACGGRNNMSRATGWGINSKDGGFQYNIEYEDQENGPGLVFIEGGTYTKGQVQDDVLHDWNNSPTQQHVMSFYIDETEVTNLMYMEYLDWLETVFPLSESRYRQIYEGALPDTLVWRNTLGYMEELTTNYLRHPAYAEYPVVGINWLQAVQFSEWRTNRVNEFILERESFVQKNIRYRAKKPFSAKIFPERYANFGPKTGVLERQKPIFVKKISRIGNFLAREPTFVQKLPNIGQFLSKNCRPGTPNANFCSKSFINRSKNPIVAENLPQQVRQC